MYAIRDRKEISKEFDDLHAAYEELRLKHNRVVEQYEGLSRAKPTQKQQLLFEENQRLREELRGLSSELQA